MLPIPADLEGPRDADVLIGLYTAGATGGASLAGYAEIRQGVGLIVWPDDVMMESNVRPYAILPADSWIASAEHWLAGFLAGRQEGIKEGDAFGRQAATAGLQAAFRVLGGLARPSDPDTLTGFFCDLGQGR